jgi:organic hydroperoxide reductase OsmC/OhrA
VSPRPKRTEYETAVAAGGRGTVARGAPLDLDDAWTPEHVLLLALARCTLASLDYHARRTSVKVSASARAIGAVGPREDGSWGFVELECRLDASLEPPPAQDELASLLARAERGCFVGASLEPAPVYHWRVNGEDVR